MRIFVKRGKAKPLWAGHPWLYSGAIEKIEGEAPAGTLVPLIDHGGTLIGWGHYSAEAQISVRLWAFAAPGAPLDAPPPDLKRLVRQRLEAARERRRLLGLPSEDTDAYRLVNSEGDRLPGVTVDVYGDVAVLLLGTPGAAAIQDTLDEAVRSLLGLSTVYRRVTLDAQRLEAVPEPDPEEHSLPSPEERLVTVREAGVRFRVDPGAGQKTGFYFDQRDHRMAVSGLAVDRDVLDVCSYIGGFSLHALMGGARRAVAVDTSVRALELAGLNAEANGVSERFETDARDAFVALRDRAAAGQRFGLVVVDPPKFARSRRDLDGALQKYTRLNELALRCLDDDGLLVTCSCSRHVSQSNLERAAAEAAQRVGRTLHLLRTGGQSPDHPTLAAFPEGRYLKVLYFQSSARH